MESVFGLWAESRYQWGAREVGLSFMIVGVISTLNQGFLAGRLARRFGESRVLATGMLLFGTSLVLQVLAPVAWFPAMRAGAWGGVDPPGAGLDHSHRHGGGGVRHVAGHAQISRP